MPRLYAEEVHKFIAANVSGRTTKELVQIVNLEFGTDFNESRMRSYKKNHELKSGTPLGLPAGRPTSLYPEHIQKFIKENHRGIGHLGMADLLNRTFGTVYTKEQIKAYYARFKLNSGLTGYFPKGHEPVNKGRKGYHAPGSEKGWFKKRTSSCQS